MLKCQHPWKSLKWISWRALTVGPDVSVQVATVLEDLAAERAAVNPLVLSGFVPLQDRSSVRETQQAAGLCCLWRPRLQPFLWGLHICTQQESRVQNSKNMHTSRIAKSFIGRVPAACLNLYFYNLDVIIPACFSWFAPPDRIYSW